MQKQDTQAPASLASWQKWLLFTLAIGGLSGIIAYFNYRVFGPQDSIPYCFALAFLCLLSFVTTWHIKRSPTTNQFQVAAFIVEVLLLLALSINAAYSLSVMREMSVAGDAERARSTTIDSIAKLRGSKTQQDALKSVGAVTGIKTRQQVFAENERVLFWIIELLRYLESIS